jgi:hypothetical protein
MGKLVDSHIHVYGRFALTVFDSESWNSVAQYFFSKTLLPCEFVMIIGMN